MTTLSTSTVSARMRTAAATFSMKRSRTSTASGSPSAAAANSARTGYGILGGPLPGDRGSGRHQLEAAALPARAQRRQPGQPGCGRSRPRPAGSAPQSTAQHQAGGEPGPEVEIRHRVRRALLRSENAPSAAALTSFSTRTARPRRASSSAPSSSPSSPRLTACETRPVSRSTAPGIADADRREVGGGVPDRAGEPLDGGDGGEQHRFGTEPGRHAHGVNSVPSSASTTASVFVPPISIPTLTARPSPQPGQQGLPDEPRRPEGRHVCVCRSGGRPAHVHDERRRVGRAGGGDQLTRPLAAMIVFADQDRAADRRRAGIPSCKTEIVSAPAAAGPHGAAPDRHVGGRLDCHDASFAAAGASGAMSNAEIARSTSNSGVGRPRPAGLGEHPRAAARARTRAAASAAGSPSRRSVRDGGLDRRLDLAELRVGVGGPMQSKSQPAATAGPRRSGIPVSPLAPAMSSASRDDDALEAELAAEQPAQDRVDEASRGARRRAAGSRMCEVMIVALPAAMAARERDAAPARAARPARGRRPAARGASRVAVSPCPGKCLALAGDAGRLQALDPRRGVPGDQCRVGAEAAGADHRVVVGLELMSASGAKFERSRRPRAARTPTRSATAR